MYLLDKDIEIMFIEAATVSLWTPYCGSHRWLNQVTIFFLIAVRISILCLSNSNITLHIP